MSSSSLDTHQDNFTPTRVRALKECPQGQKPGTIFEVTRDVADLLSHPDVGAVEILDEPKKKSKTPNEPYERRDQRARE